MQGTLSNMSFLSTSCNSRATSSDSLCLSWLPASVTGLLVSDIKKVNHNNRWASLINVLVLLYSKLLESTAFPNHNKLETNIFLKLTLPFKVKVNQRSLFEQFSQYLMLHIKAQGHR